MSYTDDADMTTIEIFKNSIADEVGTTRIINEGGTQDGDIFILEEKDIDGIANVLSGWWGEEYEYIPLTVELAKDYFSEIYPLSTDD